MSDRIEGGECEVSGQGGEGLAHEVRRGFPSVYYIVTKSASTL